MDCCGDGVVSEFFLLEIPSGGGQQQAAPPSQQPQQQQQQQPRSTPLALPPKRSTPADTGGNGGGGGSGNGNGGAFSQPPLYVPYLPQVTKSFPRKRRERERERERERVDLEPWCRNQVLPGHPGALPFGLAAGIPSSAFGGHPSVAELQYWKALSLSHGAGAPNYIGQAHLGEEMLLAQAHERDRHERAIRLATYCSSFSSGVALETRN